MFSRIFFVILVFFSAASHANDRTLPDNREQIQLSFAPLVKQVAPAVVNIYTTRTVSVRSRRQSLFNDPFFAPFFDDRMFGQRMRRQVENSLGSGVIVDESGLVVTNEHVVRGADAIRVVLNDGREFDARLTIADEASDLALLRLEEADDEDLPFVLLKPSESLEVGDLVLAIGNPFGVGQTVTSGIVSALARSSLNVNDFNFFIQTDAAINPGNSGGPLVSLDGGVIGINTAIYSRDGGSLGIGFAIPSEMVASVIAAEEYGEAPGGGVARAWMGVQSQNVTADIARSLDMQRPWGTIINALHPKSPLKKAGIKVGDVIVSLNGRDVRDGAEVKFRLATVPIGQKAAFGVLRQGRERTFQVEAMLPPEDPPRNAIQLDGGSPLAGATIGHINPAVQAELGLDYDVAEGVVVLEVPRRSHARRVVSVGDILLEINGREIEDVDDATKALRRGGERGWNFVVESNGRAKRIVLR